MADGGAKDRLALYEGDIRRGSSSWPLWVGPACMYLAASRGDKTVCIDSVWNNKSLPV